MLLTEPPALLWSRCLSLLANNTNAKNGNARDRLSSVELSSDSNTHISCRADTSKKETSHSHTHNKQTYTTTTQQTHTLKVGRLHWPYCPPSLQTCSTQTTTQQEYSSKPSFPRPSFLPSPFLLQNTNKNGIKSLSPPLHSNKRISAGHRKGHAIMPYSCHGEMPTSVDEKLSENMSMFGSNRHPI